MKLYIVPHPDKPGRWAFRWENDTAVLSDFATPEEGERIAKVFLDAQVVMPPVQLAGVPALPQRGVEQRLADLWLAPLAEDRTLPLPLVREVVSAH
jgi:hypothetical protein